MNRLHKHLISIAAIMLLAPAMCGAATYYVAVGGNNSYDGLALVYDGTHGPWATIDNGAKTSVLLPDDTVRVQAGTYDTTGASIEITSGGGTVGHPVTYVADGAVNIHASTADSHILGFGGWVSNVVVDGFNFSTAKDTAILISSASNIEVRNSHVSGGDIGIQIMQAPGALIHHNVVEGAPGSCLWVYDSANVKMYNNTVVGQSKVGIFTFYGVTGDIKNNILYSPDGWGPGGSYYGWGALDFVGNETITNTNNTIVGDPHYYWYATQGPNENFVDPIFVNAAAGDYHLAAGSPAIDTGVDVGLGYLGLAPDRGAFEFVPVPEPSGIMGLALGLFACGAFRMRMRRQG